MKVYLDSTNNLKTIIKIGQQQFTRKYSSPRDQDTFAFLVQIINQQKINPQDITQIEVNPGPGSFTGSRLGVTIANALAFALNLKVNRQSPPIRPRYPAHKTWGSLSN